MADPNGTANNRFWGMLGGASGGALGFIVANVPGLLAGAVAGNRLGAIRDAKGKSVYAVFQVSVSAFSSFLPYFDVIRIAKFHCSIGTPARRPSKTSQPTGCQGFQPCCRRLRNWKNQDHAG